MTQDPSDGTPLVRRLNAEAVLRLLRDTGPLSSGELLESTGLSRPTVHAVCDHLIELGWVSELAGVPSEGAPRPGRRARRYDFDASAGFVVGVDLGANKAVVSLADLRGDEVAQSTCVFAHEHVEALKRVGGVQMAIREVVRRAHVPSSQVLAVAVGVAAPVGADGRIRAHESYLPGMARTDLAAALGGDQRWPVLVENDANLAVLGECWRGVAQGVDDVAVLLAGERLGCGVRLGGHLLRGRHGGAGELGFLRLIEGVGNTDAIAGMCRELGGHAVLHLHVQHYQAGTGDRRSVLFDLSDGDPRNVSAETVFSAAALDDPQAVEILDRVAARIARVIAVLSTLLDPELVVIGGAVAHAMDDLLEPLTKHLGGLTDIPPRLAGSALGDCAVVVGAVRRALDHVEPQLAVTPRPASPTGGRPKTSTRTRPAGQRPAKDG